MYEEARKLEQELRRIRRKIHAHPELGFEETATASFVAERLKELGFSVREKVARTGVVASLGSGSPTVAIRADMDALPIQEETGAAYASKIPGVMHACGHDAHIACALGAARLLAGRRPSRGTVRFVFQPCEETTDDDGKSGAQKMIEEGVHEGVDAFFALHVAGNVRAGVVQVSPGPVLAAVDAFFIDILGKGCHGAYPHKGIDPVFLATHLLNLLYSLPWRRVEAARPAVLSIGSIHGGTWENIIPEKVSLSGTLRSFDEATGELLRQQVRAACRVVGELGGSYELRMERGYPPARNDPALVELVREVAVGAAGEENVEPVKVEMGSEDFALFAAKVPSVFFFLGARKGGAVSPDHHNSRFDIDDSVLPLGAAILAGSALKLIEG